MYLLIMEFLIHEKIYVLIGIISSYVNYIACYIFIDINECLQNNGGCSHNCHDTIGSYHCTCRDGYQLSSKKRSCDSKYRSLLFS